MGSFQLLIGNAPLSNKAVCKKKYWYVASIIFAFDSIWWLQTSSWISTVTYASYYWKLQIYFLSLMLETDGFMHLSNLCDGFMHLYCGAVTKLSKALKHGLLSAFIIYDI